MSAPGQPPSSSSSALTAATAVATASASRPSSPATVVPTAQIALPPLDLEAVQASLTTISRAVERVTTQATLELNHATLQKAYQAKRARADALDRELRDARAAAAPFVQFCQHCYDLIRHELRELRISRAEALDALVDRHDNSREIAATRDQLRVESDAHEEVVAYLHALVDDLEQRTNNQAPPGLARRILPLQGDATMAVADQDRALQDLHQARDDITAYETSQKALENATGRLQHQISILERRVSDLQSGHDSDVTRHQRQLERAFGERDRFQFRVRDVEAQLRQVSADLRRVTAERDGATTALQNNQSQIVAFRTATARLEQRVSDLQPVQDRLRILEHEKARLIADLAAARASVRDMAAERDQAHGERDAIRDRVAGLVSFLQPVSAAGPPLRAASGKRRRSQSPSASPDPSRSHGRRRTSSSARSPGSGRLGSLRDSCQGDRGKGHGGDRSDNQDGDQSDDQDGDSDGDQDSDSDDDQDSELDEDQNGDPDNHRDGDPDNHRDGDPDSDRGGDSHDSDESSAHSDDSITSVPRVHRNRMMSDARYRHLPPALVPRPDWIPGYRHRLEFPQAAITPWRPRRIRKVSVLEMKISVLFHHFAQPKNWLFPLKESGASPSPSLWSPHSLTETNIRALYATSPWIVLCTVVTPISFPMSGWFEALVRRYIRLEDEHRQALWEAAHGLPISSALRKNTHS